MSNSYPINKFENYFPNATKLTFEYSWPSPDYSMDINLSCIISLEQLTEIVVEDSPIYFMQFVKLLSVAVNLHRLKFDYVSIGEINPATIEEDPIFQLVSKKNVVKNLTLTYDGSLEIVELFFALCPRLQHFELHYVITPFLPPLIRFILSKTNNNNRHLSSWSILQETVETEEILKMVIKNDQLFDDYKVEYFDNEIHVWW
ncbi:unnamed protein product [Adineta steineri]|uniref:Uncharacterized protein n=1 Tax=Adineta steineri TaxID=433720 RepID=A0A814D456_9BILA|nr:unnamed protein product [Adineta steineri]